MASYNPLTGNWYVFGPNGRQLLGKFGDPSKKDIPVPGDYLKLGYTQLAYYRPGTGEWFVRLSNGTTSKLGKLGDPTKKDIPVPGD